MPSKGHGASKQPWASDKQGKKDLDPLERSVERKLYLYRVSACSIQCPSPNLEANFSTTTRVKGSSMHGTIPAKGHAPQCSHVQKEEEAIVRSSVHYISTKIGAT